MCFGQTLSHSSSCTRQKTRPAQLSHSSPSDLNKVLQLVLCTSPAVQYLMFLYKSFGPNRKQEVFQCHVFSVGSGNLEHVFLFICVFMKK